MTTPAIEVVIAVHNTTRPIRQAVESVLSAGADARALVVAHEVPAVEIEALLSDLDGGRVRVVGFSDGIRSPAGPFNHGLAIAEAEFVSILGSDDGFEPGALDAALRRAQDDGADAVVLPLRLPGIVRVRNPLSRRGRSRELDPVKDRLYGRTAPLALIRRATVERFAPIFDSGFETGEDLEFGARLWSEASVSYAHLDPAYVGGVDAADRVTQTDPDLRRGLAAARALGTRAWVASLDRARRRALATKILRVSILGGLTNRSSDPEPMSADEIEILAETRRTWLRLSPTAEHPLPIADRWVLDACRPDTGDRALRDVIARRRRAGAFARNLTRNPFLAYSGDSVLRRYAIYERLRREESVLT